MEAVARVRILVVDVSVEVLEFLRGRTKKASRQKEQIPLLIK